MNTYDSNVIVEIIIHSLVSPCFSGITVIPPRCFWILRFRLWFRVGEKATASCQHPSPFLGELQCRCTCFFTPHFWVCMESFYTFYNMLYALLLLHWFTFPCIVHLAYVRYVFIVLFVILKTTFTLLTRLHSFNDP